MYKCEEDEPKSRARVGGECGGENNTLKVKLRLEVLVSPSCGLTFFDFFSSPSWFWFFALTMVDRLDGDQIGFDFERKTYLMTVSA